MPRLPDVPEPMLARLANRVPVGTAWSYEVKWDGCVAQRTGPGTYGTN
jgi:ATP-dependent DNA ligase